MQRVNDGVPSISSVEADWSRENFSQWWSPGPQVLRSIRRYQHWAGLPGFFPDLIKKYWVLCHRFWSVVAGCDIPLNCRIGGGLRLTHPNGIVVHPNSNIGVNCLILQQVTISEGVELGGHVDIGAGAKLIKSVKIGNHAKIGANAVVLTDIPAGAVAVGVPARVICH